MIRGPSIDKRRPFVVFCDFSYRGGPTVQTTAMAKAAPRVRSQPAGRIEIAFQRCKACELCFHACPTGCIEAGTALNAQGYAAAVFARPDDCSGCALCAEACPDVAIQVWR